MLKVYNVLLFCMFRTVLSVFIVYRQCCLCVLKHDIVYFVYNLFLWTSLQFIIFFLFYLKVNKFGKYTYVAVFFLNSKQKVNIK